MSQTLVGDEAVLTTLTVDMIVCIARANNKSWGAADAITTFGVTEVLGWIAYILVKDDKNPRNLTLEEKEQIKQRAEQLRNKDLPDDTIKYLTKRLESIARKYVD